MGMHLRETLRNAATNRKVVCAGVTKLPPECSAKVIMMGLDTFS